MRSGTRTMMARNARVGGVTQGVVAQGGVPQQQPQLFQQVAPAAPPQPPPPVTQFAQATPGADSLSLPGMDMGAGGDVEVNLDAMGGESAAPSTMEGITGSKNTYIAAAIGVFGFVVWWIHNDENYNKSKKKKEALMRQRKMRNMPKNGQQGAAANRQHAAHPAPATLGGVYGGGGGGGAYRMTGY